MMQKPLRVSKGVYFYTPKAYEDNGRITVEYRALSEKELRSLENVVEQQGKSQAMLRACEFAITNISHISNNKITLDDLPFDTVAEIADEIFRVSVLGEEEYTKLITSIILKTNDSFMESETWKCEVCKAKRLDKTRNCGYLSEEDQKKYYNPDFNIRVGGSVYTHCPIFDIDTELLSTAIECNNILELGVLPDEGGFLDQTRFFVIASQELKYRLHEAEVRKMKEKQKNHK